jgi:alpha-tubulin suppressor-like RCC1 family protein
MSAAAGWDFSLGIEADGAGRRTCSCCSAQIFFNTSNHLAVLGWGCNAFGQLHRLPGGTRAEVLLPACRVVAAGLRHSLAIDDQGLLWAWGHNRKVRCCHSHEASLPGGPP